MCYQPTGSISVNGGPDLHSSSASPDDLHLSNAPFMILTSRLESFSLDVPCPPLSTTNFRTASSTISPSAKSPLIVPFTSPLEHHTDYLQKFHSRRFN